MASRTPPRYVPTLTEVVKEGIPLAAKPSRSHEQLVQRVMQQIDLVLERRLREAVAAVVLEHTRNLGPALRDEIQDVVAEAVAQALVDELAAPGDPAGR